MMSRKWDFSPGMEKKTKMLLHIIENDKNLWQTTGPSHVFRYMENI